MKPAVTLEQAQAAVRVLYDQRKQEELKGEFFLKFPDTRERFLRQTLMLIPPDRGMSWLRRTFERPLVVLQWLVAVVLLIACTNVTNLLLARAAARQREIAIRGALGASRGKIVRQLFIESTILAVAGGAAGLLLSAWLTRGLVRSLPYDPAILSLSTTPDTRVLLFTTAVTLTTAFLFGLVPAFRGSRVPASATLKEEAESVTGGLGHVRLRLVICEMLAMILLGLAAGVAAAYLCGSYVETQLFGVKAVDGPVFAISVATLLAASLVASFAPAWRASRISPLRALRYE